MINFFCKKKRRGAGGIINMEILPPKCEGWVGEGAGVRRVKKVGGHVCSGLRKGGSLVCSGLRKGGGLRKGVLYAVILGREGVLGRESCMQWS